MAEWVPVNQNHAIEVMAAVITLHEPLPNLIQRRTFKATEDLAFSLGLRSRHILSGETMFAPGVVIQIGPPARDATPSGYLFNSMADAPETGERGSRPTEQIEIRGSSIVYRTWQYISWSWNIARMKQLVTPFIDAARDVVPVQNIRLEYLDKFIFSESEEPADLSLLLKPNCPVISPQAYSTHEHFHSHSGIVVRNLDGVQRISIANLDSTDVEQNNEKFRGLNIVTAFEDRRSLEADSADHDIVDKTLNEMHAGLKLALGQIISDDIADRIYLKD